MNSILVFFAPEILTCLITLILTIVMVCMLLQAKNGQNISVETIKTLGIVEMFVSIICAIILILSIGKYGIICFVLLLVNSLRLLAAILFCRSVKKVKWAKMGVMLNLLSILMDIIIITFVAATI